MGMDVYGKAPRTKTGEYFRNNVWWWHPLAKYVQASVPSIAYRVKHWHSNDGSGLGDKLSQQLAAALEQLVADGHTAAYAQGRDDFSVENVQEFIAFLKDCGGFEIC
jgi:hypothetical protein